LKTATRLRGYTLEIAVTLIPKLKAQRFINMLKHKTYARRENFTTSFSQAVKMAAAEKKKHTRKSEEHY